MNRVRILGRKPVLGILAGLTGALIAVFMMMAGWLDSWEARTWDWRVRALARPGPATDDIVLILLDQNSLDWAQKENGLSWPWPREIYGAIVDYCRRNGARALAIDVLYTEPSAYGVADDGSFAAAVGKFGKVAGAVFLGKKSGSQVTWPAATPEPRLKLAGLAGNAAAIPLAAFTFSRATFPIAALVENSAVLGNVQLKPDPDGVYRRVKLFSVFAERPVPALGLGAWLAAGNQAQIARGQGQSQHIGDREIPVDSKENAILRYRDLRGPTATSRRPLSCSPRSATAWGSLRLSAIRPLLRINTCCSGFQRPVCWTYGRHRWPEYIPVSKSTPPYWTIFSPVISFGRFRWHSP